MKLTIEREKWLRGEADSLLLRARDGKMCCLGFFGLACGLSAQQIWQRITPHVAKSDKWPDWLREAGPKSYCNLLMDINDFVGTPEDLREAEIAAEFAKHGVEVEFV